MANESITVNARLRATGVFWDAKNPDQRFSATLTCDGRYIELVSAAELVTPDVRLLNNWLNGVLEEAPDVIHGFTTQGDCTLLGVQAFNDPSHADLQTNRALSIRQFRVSVCVFGICLDDDHTATIKGACFTYSGLAEWLPSPGSVSFKEDSIEVSYPKKLQTVAEVSFEDRIRLRLEVAPGFQMRRGPIRHVARSQPRLVVEPTEPKSLEWFVDMAVRFENFFSLCLGTSVCLQTLSFATMEEQKAWLVLPRRVKAQKTDIEAWVRTDSITLGTAISRWLCSKSEFRQLEDLVYGTMRHSSMFVETEFLTLAQAIEAYHRLTDSSKVVDSAEFRHILKVICTAIASECKDSPLQQRFLDGIRHANDLPFKDRVNSLLSRLSRENAERLFGDLTEFERKLRQTRNYLTHPGIRKNSSVITRGKELFLFNQKLHAFLRLLLLLGIGFPEDKVFETVYHQAQKWQ